MWLRWARKREAISSVLHTASCTRARSSRLRSARHETAASLLHISGLSLRTTRSCSAHVYTTPAAVPQQIHAVAASRSESPRVAAIVHKSSARRRKPQRAAATTKLNHGRRPKETRQQVTKPRPATKGPLAE